MNSTRHAPPAPLPYASQAGRGDIPATPPTTRTDPDAPLLREDELCLWVTVGIIVVFVLLMLVVSLVGGL